MGLTAYSFRDRTFAPSGDTLVCVIESKELGEFMSLKELSFAFSGHVVYRQGLLRRYIGVWGRRNGKRLRRFLQERGAAVDIQHAKPEGARVTVFATDNVRKRVRELSAIVS